MSQWDFYVGGVSAGSMRIKEGILLLMERISKKEGEIPNISGRAIPLRAFTILQIGIRMPHGQPVEPGSGDPNIRESSLSCASPPVPGGELHSLVIHSDPLIRVLQQRGNGSRAY
jgi:hypothetical protein